MKEFTLFVSIMFVLAFFMYGWFRFTQDVAGFIMGRWEKFKERKIMELQKRKDEEFKRIQQYVKRIHDNAKREADETIKQFQLNYETQEFLENMRRFDEESRKRSFMVGGKDEHND